MMKNNLWLVRLSELQYLLQWMMRIGQTFAAERRGQSFKNGVSVTRTHVTQILFAKRVENVTNRLRKNYPTQGRLKTLSRSSWTATNSRTKKYKIKNGVPVVEMKIPERRRLKNMSDENAFANYTNLVRSFRKLRTSLMKTAML